MQKEYMLDGEPVTDIDEFLSDNRDFFGSEDCALIRAMRPGHEISFGGGASPLITLSVVQSKRGGEE